MILYLNLFNFPRNDRFPCMEMPAELVQNVIFVIYRVVVFMHTIMVKLEPNRSEKLPTYTITLEVAHFVPFH